MTTLHFHFWTPLQIPWKLKKYFRNTGKHHRVSYLQFVTLQRTWKLGESKVNYLVCECFENLGQCFKWIEHFEVAQEFVWQLIVNIWHIDVQFLWPFWLHVLYTNSLMNLNTNIVWLIDFSRNHDSRSFKNHNLNTLRFSTKKIIISNNLFILFLNLIFINSSWGNYF